MVRVPGNHHPHLDVYIKNHTTSDSDGWQVSIQKPVIIWRIKETCQGVSVSQKRNRCCSFLSKTLQSEETCSTGKHHRTPRGSSGSDVCPRVSLKHSAREPRLKPSFCVTSEETVKQLKHNWTRFWCNVTVQLQFQFSFRSDVLQTKEDTYCGPRWKRKVQHVLFRMAQTL